MRIAFAALAFLSLVSAPGLARAEDVTPPSEEMLKLRDPFKRPDVEELDTIKKTELETFGVDTLKMVGTISGPDRMRAMILAPDGHTYFVSVNTKIGLRGGQVKKIESGGVVVREKVVNVLGQEEDLDTTIRIGDDKKSQDQMAH